MDPSQIARIIAENEEYDTCPVCGSKYAAIEGDRVTCPSENCPNYDKGYAEALEAVEGATVKIDAYYVDPYEFDWNNIVDLMDIARNTNVNYRAIDIPNDIGPYTFSENPDDEGMAFILLFWKGSDAVSDETLRRKFVEHVHSWPRAQYYQ